ncbi:transcriptional repressor [Rhodobacteraceae bacterium KN286]|uniref:Ferric uptake regulation protein n=2 Tax=Oceanomicrobium pacificus TaxID=2692916 RepID=A0A6B0TT99_9RHOB|nr:transcriptional repressor [Oceanomicrobium pacificus]
MHAKRSGDSTRLASAWLVNAGLRPTRQRLALAELLVGDGQNRHVSAESLYEAAQDSETPVSLATVYNTLRTFCDVGIMREIAIEGTRSYFDTRMDAHDHYFWEDENLLTDAPAGAVQIHQMMDAPAGTEIAKIEVVIRLRRKG